MLFRAVWYSARAGVKTICFLAWLVFFFFLLRLRRTEGGGGTDGPRVPSPKCLKPLNHWIPGGSRWFGSVGKLLILIKIESGYISWILSQHRVLDDVQFIFFTQSLTSSSVHHTMWVYAQKKNSISFYFNFPSILKYFNFPIWAIHRCFESSQDFGIKVRGPKPKKKKFVLEYTRQLTLVIYFVVNAIAWTWIIL